ncbi:crosslink repair DNA glycosylase YcaQ family protein [Georgenia sp. M64]|uniref:DNA glycosylase AlkZ-like family protein n=1 Tax=Georgenia sp. M64 TaxID=3120520 RepID=UPI0030E2CFA2
MPLQLTRSDVLAFRRSVGALDERRAPGSDALRRAAWAGLQDSTPRSALLSLHARLTGVTSDAWEDPALVQVWGPRFSAYVVHAADRAVFTVGRLPVDARRRAETQALADRLEDWLGGEAATYGAAGRGLGVAPNSLRYAAPTGRVLIRWDGARQPVVRMVPPPDVDPAEARLELARRYLHVFAPGTPEGFASWAGVRPRAAVATVEALRDELTPVRTAVGDGWILAADEPALRAPDGSPAHVRLLPSGDAFTLLQGVDRELLVPDAGRRAQLWTPRVWPGAVLVGGEVVGTWRRAGGVVTIAAWTTLSREDRDAVEAEATSLPLPDALTVTVRWAES